MFFVVNKEKIKSYLVSVTTVAVLLAISIAMQNNVGDKTLQTASSISKTTEKEVVLIINCIKNMKNINNIINELSKAKSTATFLVTDELANKYPEEIKRIRGSGNEITTQLEKNLPEISIILTNNEYIQNNMGKIIKSINEKGYTVKKVSDIKGEEHGVNWNYNKS